MASSNFDQYDVGDNVREDLSNVITNIAPTKTPFISRIAGMKGKATQSYHEWIKDDLGAVDGSNARIDGADAGADTSDKGDRIGNYCQISDKPIRISGRADKANKAGRTREMKYQLMKAAKKLKRDMETIVTGNQASAAGNSTTASTTGSLRAWIETNTDLGATGADGGFASGTVSAATDGTARALSEDDVLTVIENCYTAGGEPNVIMVSPAVKRRFSAYMFGSSARIATPYQEGNNAPMTAVGAVDVYVSDFGKLMVVPNRFQRDRDLFVLDSSLWNVAMYRSFQTNKLAKTGDAENRQLLVDYCLVSKDESGSGGVFDIDHTTAMVA